MKQDRLSDKQFRQLSVKFTIFVLVYFFASVAFSRTVKVAVIDTGFDTTSTWPTLDKNYISGSLEGLTMPKICENGLFNTVDDSTNVFDTHGHGTHIAGLLAKGNKKLDYCLYIMKYLSSDKDNLPFSNKALLKAIELNVDIINYSGGGVERNEEECTIIKRALDQGIAVIAAAGNEKSDLTKQGYYPALCDSRIVVVMNVNSSGERVESSNYGPTAVPETGLNITSLGTNNMFAIMTGTSQATAIYTNKLIKTLHYQFKRDCHKEVCLCRN